MMMNVIRKQRSIEHVEWMNFLDNKTVGFIIFLTRTRIQLFFEKSESRTENKMWSISKALFTVMGQSRRFIT